MSFYTALTGLNGSQADISATSNNIANVATTGYKRSKAEFGDIFATSPLQNMRPQEIKSLPIQFDHL